MPTKQMIIFNFPYSSIYVAADINLGADGSLSGQLPIWRAYGDGTPSTTSGTVDLAGGMLAFEFEGPTPDGHGGFNYTGGTFTITGTPAGGSAETILTGNLGASRLRTEPVYNPGDPPPFYLWPSGAPFSGGVVAADIATAFGATSPGTGFLYLYVTQATPGGSATLYGPGVGLNTA